MIINKREVNKAAEVLKVCYLINDSMIRDLVATLDKRCSVPEKLVA